MTRPMISALALASALLVAAPAAAQLAPPPPPPEASRVAVPYLDTAGMSDVYEITSSEIALKRSQNPALRDYASMLIRHHTETTNGALAAAKAAGVTPPAPILNAPFRALIAELNTVPAADFDRVYIGQQIPAHEGALKLNTEYAAGGDTPQLQRAAATAAPIVQRHLDMARQMQGGM